MGATGKAFEPSRFVPNNNEERGFNSMIYKILGAFIIMAAGVLAFLTFKQEGIVLGKKKNTPKAEVACVQLTPAEQLVKLIDDDFKQLAREGQLPAAWGNIATVEYRNGSELARALLGNAKPGIQRVKDGTSYLEVEILDMPDETNPGIILQTSLFDIKSKNKIFEIGRTYTMNDLNHQIPPEQPKKEDPKNKPAGQNQPAQQGQPQANIQQQTPGGQAQQQGTNSTAAPQQNSPATQLQQQGQPRTQPSQQGRPQQAPGNQQHPQDGFQQL